MKAYKLLLILIFYAVPSCCYGQNSIWTGMVQDTHGLLAEGSNIAVDKNGNSYALGVGFINDTTEGALIAKYNTNGNIIWSKIIKSTYDYFSFTAGGIATDANGNIYVSGYFRDSLFLNNDTIRRTGSEVAFFLIKFDSLGNTIYHKSISGCSFYGQTCLAVDQNNDLYLCGNFVSPRIAFDTFVLTNVTTTNPDFFIVKYDQNGNVIYAHSFGGSNAEIESAISIDDSNNVIIAGVFNSTDLNINGNVLSSESGLGAFLVKCNSSGQVVWSKLAGVNHYIDYPLYAYVLSGVTTDPTGNIYTTGTFYDSLEIGNLNFAIAAPGASNHEAGYYAKFASDGHFLWAKKYGGVYVDQGFGIARDPNNSNIVLTGGISSPAIVVGGLRLVSTNGPTNPTFNEDGSFIAECDQDGNGICGSVAAYGGDDILALAIDNSGFVYTCGDAMTGQRFPDGDTGTVVRGQESIFISKIDRCPGTINKVKEVVDENEVNIFPNPADIEVTISYTGALDNDASVTLFDLTGRVVYNSLMNGRSLTISVSGLSKAMYFCKVIFNGQTITRKILVQ